MHEAVVFSQPLDLLVVIILHHCFQTAVISGSGLKVGMVSQKYSSRKKNPPFQNPRSAPESGIIIELAGPGKLKVGVLVGLNGMWRHCRPIQVVRGRVNLGSPKNILLCLP